jgi:hypothetical protein
VYVHAHDWIGVYQLLKLDQHRMQHYLLPPGLDSIPVTGEPRLQVVLVVRQPTGLPAYIYSIRPSRHELVEARRECDRGDGGNRRLRQRCVAQRPISTPSSPAIGASASGSSLASTS